MTCNRILTVLLSACPLVVVAGLLYAAMFIKPELAGDTVTPPAITRGDFLYGVAIPEPGLLWAAGSDGKVWRSADEGRSWTVQRTPTRLTLQDIGAWDTARAVAVGDDGIVLRTDDGGANWTQVAVPRSRVSNKLMRVFVRAGGEAWAVGEMGMVLNSTDYGASWRQARVEEDAAWNGVFANGKTVWLVGEFGRIAFSVDAGKSWSLVKRPAQDGGSLIAVAFRNDMEGMAVGLDSVMLHTTDAGRTWKALPKVTPEHLFDVMWDGARWAAVGDKGALVLGDRDAARWEARRVSPDDRQWHTRIVRSGAHYIAAGGSLAMVAIR